MMAVWLSSNSVAHINQVNLHRARLVLWCVTVSGFKLQFPVQDI